MEFDTRAYWEDRLSSRFDLVGVGHASLPNAYNRWMYRVRRRVFERVVRQLELDLASASVLDVGSGTGFYLERWAAAGVLDLQGVDISPTAARNLRHRFPGVRIREIDIGAEDAVVGCNACFDVVSAMDVLFHVVDDGAFRRALGNIAAVLKEGGVLVFSDNFLRGPEVRLQHIKHRRLDEVLAGLREARLDVVARQPMFVLMNEPVDTPSLRARLRWSVIRRAAQTGELMGWLMGAALYPLELALTRLRSEGPSTEIMVCRKRVLAPPNRKAGG